MLLVGNRNIKKLWYDSCSSRDKLKIYKIMINSIKTYLEGLGMPSYGAIDKMKYEQGVLTIYYCDFYRILIDKNPSWDGIIANEVLIWRTRDLRFALNILDSREEILEMIDNNVEFFEADFCDCIAHIKHYGEEEEEVILED